MDVFRKHDDLPGVLDEAVAAGAKTLWLQLGSWHEDVARDAETAGLNVVMDRCVKIEHARFHGGLHLAGFDTGVISSKRQVLCPSAAFKPLLPLIRGVLELLFNPLVAESGRQVPGFGSIRPGHSLCWFTGTLQRSIRPGSLLLLLLARAGLCLRAQGWIRRSIGLWGGA